MTSKNRSLKEPELTRQASLYRGSQRWRGFPGGSGVKTLPVSARDVSLNPGLGRSPAEGNGIPLQYSCLGNAMGRGPGGLQSWDHKELDTTKQLNKNSHRWKAQYLCPVLESRCLEPGFTSLLASSLPLLVPQSLICKMFISHLIEIPLDYIHSVPCMDLSYYYNCHFYCHFYHDVVLLC